VEVANRCRWVTLRLHPVGPPLLVPHHARQDTVVAGYDVPADARVLVHVRAIAPDPASWPDRTDAFLPERFLPGAGGCDGGVDVHGQHFELLPFGSGRRISPASNLAKKMVALGVASLLQGFAWRLPDRGREHGGAGQAVHTPEGAARHRRRAQAAATSLRRRRRMNVGERTTLLRISKKKEEKKERGKRVLTWHADMYGPRGFHADSAAT
jgi:hypothetical protein